MPRWLGLGYTTVDELAIIFVKNRLSHKWCSFNSGDLHQGLEIKALRTNNETLQNINSLFADIMGRFHLYFFHETRSTDVKGTRELIVDESSAAPYFEGVERMGIEADHSHMCKFADEDAPGFEAVAEALLRYSRDAPLTIFDRWVEEEKTRLVIRQTKAKEIFNNGRSVMCNKP